MAKKPVLRRPVALPDSETAAGGWLRGIRVSGFSFVMMGVLILAIVVLAPGVGTFLEQRQEIDRLSAAVTAEQLAVDDLRAERERWNDRTYVTTQARDRLFYVLPGDVNFLVYNDLNLPAAPSQAAPTVSADIQDTDVDWISSMFASVMIAGLAPAADSAPAADPAATTEPTARAAVQ